MLLAKPSWIGVILDRDKTVQWVGATLLKAQYHSAGITVSSFMKLWRDLLPESWRELAVLESLAVSLCLSFPAAHS